MSPYSSQIGGMGCAFVRGALVRESPAPDDSGPVANPYSTPRGHSGSGSEGLAQQATLSLFSERLYSTDRPRAPSIRVV